MKILLPLLIILVSFSGLAEDVSQKLPVLLIEPSFEYPPISTSLPGAKRTLIAAGIITKNPINKESISFLQPSWKITNKNEMNAFVKKARENLSLVLSTIKPSFLRDEHQVIQVALLQSSNPLTASTVLAPNFSEQFIPIFGPDLLLVIPSANRVYIFSKLVSPLKDIAQAIRDDYKLSSTPISTEVFELTHGKLHAIGSLD